MTTIINNSLLGMKMIAYTLLGSLVVMMMGLGVYTIFSGVDFKQLFATLFTLCWIGVVVNAFRE